MIINNRLNFKKINKGLIMKLYAITGSIGTGKSTALKIFKKLGYATIDCDILAKKVFLKKINEIKKVCKPSLFTEGRLSMSKFKKEFFENEMFKQEIEKIIHPFVKFEVFKRVTYHFFTNKKAVLIEVPLFFELNLDRFFDSILITCDKKKQSDRILGRDGHKNIDNKINAQLDMNFKIKRATYVIYNDGNTNTLQKKLENFKVDGNSFLTYLGLIYLIILLSMVINKNM